MIQMGRPRIHDSDQLLDAAADIAASEGPAALSMAGVAKATGAPSGSVYHLFPTRATLLGELWLRSIRAFQSGYLEELDGEDPVRSCIDAGTFVVTWSRENQREARIFLHGSREFGAADWPDDLRDRILSVQKELEEGLGAAAGRIDVPGGMALERVLLVCVDIPYALVRRHLSLGQEIPAGIEVLIGECAHATLVPA